MLRFDDVTIRRGDFALRASFEVGPGLTAVIGPSGGGKSTLLSAVAGFEEPAQGRVLWNGESLSGQAPGARPLAMLFQDQNLFPHLSIAENVGLGLRPALKLTADERARVEDALTSVGLAGMGGRRPAQLSGGQQSRAALARVLVSGAPLVLLDEPFAALGPGLRVEMLELVARVLKGRVVLLVSHTPEDARQGAARTILVAQGVAHAPVETGALFDAPPAALRDYLGR